MNTLGKLTLCLNQSTPTTQLWTTLESLNADGLHRCGPYESHPTLPETAQGNSLRHEACLHPPRHPRRSPLLALVLLVPRRSRISSSVLGIQVGLSRQAKQALSGLERQVPSRLGTKPADQGFLIVNPTTARRGNGPVRCSSSEARDHSHAHWRAPRIHTAVPSRLYQRPASKQPSSVPQNNQQSSQYWSK